MAQIITHIITIFIHRFGVIKSAAFTGCNIHINPTAITHNHKLNNQSINNATKINQNTTISINALGFAIPARANNTHDNSTYFIIFLSIFICFSVSHKLRIKINQANIAKIVKAITHRSVLLSTNTKNAHIQLVNQSNKVIHQIPNEIVFVSSESFFFSEKYHKTSSISHNPKIKHRGPVR